ncbi:tripartite tricarboxylate transporter TctB family protein [Limoniibacter endophyticus]|uniref:C4-dicarboxylate ABC transporter n=1 Tax=Limoniibacter endophyticus TaxID=1565040 RepID=A0A8J3GIJ6_9HYPH|nr:tripartite tricarboxylate transporter TctB family protein [Limoniibacter endophyticus]GHC77796.1 C4-dicarboxylate ABC transporter [Limoniibacter endophyticus]
MNHEDDNGIEESRPGRAAFFIAFGLAILGGIILWDASHLAAGSGYSPVGPSTVPLVIGTGLLGLAIWTLVAAVRGDFPERPQQEIAPIAWVVAGLAFQLLFLHMLGFSLATGFLFAATAAAFGQKKFWISVPLGIALSFFVWAIFSQLLMLSLPAGPLERLFF